MRDYDMIGPRRRVVHAPQCPHCGDIATNGDARLVWISMHIDSRRHRWWWRLKKKFGKASL